MSLAGPDSDCSRCPRLVGYRATNGAQFPDWHNAPVDSFGGADARLLVVGLAPGLRGANRTGRPFTGDYAGDLLYATLCAFGFAEGSYAATAGDGLALLDCRITNALRCVPPENKPTGEELRQCRPYLANEINGLGRLHVILALGRIAHEAVLGALDLRRTSHPFAHGARHAMPAGRALYDSYHCSRYNTNTRRLTTEMFQAVFSEIRKELGTQA